MSRNVFRDPAGVRPDYPWAINHDEEQEGGRDRAFDFTANTGNVGLVKQQGDLTPTTLSYKGRILTLAQLNAMWAWFNLCETQTIYFTDFAGDSYEVTIQSFKPQRERAVRNSRDLVNAPTHTWSYSIEMVVVRVLGGSLLGQPT